MKIIRWVLAGLCFLSISTAQKRFGKISLPLGRVQVNVGNNWSKAKPNQAVFEGNIIKTETKSRCEITLSGGGKVRIGENSELELNNAQVKPMVKNFNANLKKGNVWVSAKAAFGEKKNIAIRTPTAVAAIRGTVFKARAGNEQSSIQVYDGSVDVNQAKNFLEERQNRRKGLSPNQGTNKPKFRLGPVTEVDAPNQISGPFEISLEEWITLAKGMQINVRADGKYHMFEFDEEKDEQDGFVKWNKELDSGN